MGIPYTIPGRHCHLLYYIMLRELLTEWFQCNFHDTTYGCLGIKQYSYFNIYVYSLPIVISEQIREYKAIKVFLRYAKYEDRIFREGY